MVHVYLVHSSFRADDVGLTLSGLLLVLSSSPAQGNQPQQQQQQQQQQYPQQQQQQPQQQQWGGVQVFLNLSSMSCVSSVPPWILARHAQLS